MEWPAPAAIVTEQKHQLTTEHTRSIAGCEMYTDVNGRIALPTASQLTRHVIGVCHTGDLRHRSIQGTVDEFRKHYYLHDLQRTEERRHIREECAKCLGCIKSRTQQIVPRPLWYMTYATKPFDSTSLSFRTRRM